MPTISIAIQKGGSGKTTTAINLSAAWQLMGKKVLLIDLDPQANCTQALGYENEQERSIHQLLKAEAAGQLVPLDQIIKEEKDIDFIPSSWSLASAELEFAGVYGREGLLQAVLEPLQSLYDYIVIDCPPSMGLLTVNALAASDMVMMPMQAEFLPLQGVQSFWQHCENLRKKINPNLSLLGFVLTQFDSRKNMTKSTIEKLSELYPDKLFSTRIRRNVALVEAQQKGVDIFTFDKNSNGAKDYMALAEEALGRING